MSIEKDMTALFDDYQNDNLSAEEKHTFDDRLKNDAAFAKNFESHIKNVQVIKALGIREEMNEIMEERVPSSRAFKTSYLIPIGIAAALALSLFFLPEKAIDNHTLFEEYFAPYPNAISGRDSNGAFDEAMDDYTKNQYRESIEQFKNLYRNDTMHFYKGISHLAIDEPEEALIEFSEISTRSIFVESIVWYKALSFLLLDETDSVRINLLKIEVGSSYYRKAQAIIEELENQE